MKHLLALLLYHAGDLLSKLDSNVMTTYPLYNWCMSKSIELDDGRVWVDTTTEIERALEDKRNGNS